MKLSKLYLQFAIILLFSSWVNSRHLPVQKNLSPTFSVACTRPVAQYNMQVNNVRARLLTGGDLWYAGQTPGGYIVPANKPNMSAVSAIYTGGIWVGGHDRAGNIKFSGSTYKSDGFDFFTGPLDVNGTTEKTICDQWDQIFSVKGANIIKQIELYKISKEENSTINCEQIPDDIKYWPGQGNPFWYENFNFALPDIPMAAYWDMNSDGRYDPCDGDYPYILDQTCQWGYHEGQRVPAEINYFIFNDNGGPQSLSGPSAMQMEFQVNAFAYSTNDAINDMTFYQYNMINKSIEDIRDFYFSMWVDADLGCSVDDYIGCDPDLGMAYVYNQDVIDGDNDLSCDGINTYVTQIPIVGFDFVRGPLVSKVFKRDGLDNFIYDGSGQKIIIDPPIYSGQQDTLVESGMTSFIYNERASLGSFPPGTTDPQRGKDDGFYNYIRGMWRDGTPITKGGSGYTPGSTDTVKFAFPDAPNDPTGWSMCTADLPIGDRRFIMSVGPMLLQSGARRDLVLSVFTSLDEKYPCPDITKLKYIDEIAQSLFEDCFDSYIQGPDHPELIGIENDRKIILSWYNNKTSNNYNESYAKKINNLSQGFDDYYRFEGYKIFQLKDGNVSVNQLNDPQYARIIAQSDVKNSISKIYNWEFTNNTDTTTGADPYIWSPKLMVNGNNQGVQTTFPFTEDQFAFGDKTIINGRNYYFMTVAYAHNNWRSFDNVEKFGQTVPYLEGHPSQIYKFEPNRTIDQDDLLFQVTRISGEGNPHTFLEIEDNVYDKILGQNFDGKIKYKKGLGPIQAKVLDTNKIKKNSIYRLEVNGTFNYLTNNCSYGEDAFWTLTDITENKILLDDKPLSDIKEYVIDELGFSLILHNHTEPGSQFYANNGGVGAELVYKNPNGPFWFNSITMGGLYKKPNIKTKFYDFVRTIPDKDPNNDLSTMGEGFFVPFLSTKSDLDPDGIAYLSPSAREFMAFMLSPINDLVKFRDLNNVDIVFTSDKSKWSKCVVVETTTPDYTTSGYASINNTKNFEMRQSPSIDQDGKLLSDNSVGFSYFPGYAIDVETGKRLNVFFGENSVYSGSNAELIDDKMPIGGDLIFNPSSQAFIGNDVIRNPITNEVIGIKDIRALVAGGQHYIYITRQEYDGCTEIASKLKRTSNGSGPNILNKAKVGAAITWVSFPVLMPGMSMNSIQNGLIPNDLIVKLRVNNPYGESRRFNINREKNCETVGDHPVYEFGFEGLSKTEDNDFGLSMVLSPNPASILNGNTSIQITNLPEYATIALMDIKGNLISQFSKSEGQTLHYSGPGATMTTFLLNNGTLQHGLYLVKIKNHQTGQSKTLKWIVL